MCEFFRSPTQSAYYLKRPTYPPLAVDAIIKFCTAFRRHSRYVQCTDNAKLDLVVDVGCGSGQLTKLLAPYAVKLIAIDSSESQIGEAKRSQTQAESRIEYRVGSANSLPVEPETVDLLTVAQALHWFDLSVFYKEVDRCLKPGGTAAFLSYAIQYLVLDDKEVERRINTAIEKYYLGDDQLGPFWEDCTRERFVRYVNVPFPYEVNALRVESEMTSVITLAHLADFYRSFSAYSPYCKANPDRPDIVDQIIKFILNALGNPTSGMETEVTSGYPLVTLLSVKPAN